MINIIHIGSRDIEVSMGGIETLVYQLKKNPAGNIKHINYNCSVGETVFYKFKNLLPEVSYNKYITSNKFSICIAQFWHNYKSENKLYHLHGLGSIWLAPLLKLLGFSIIYTHHSEDYFNHKLSLLRRLICYLLLLNGFFCDRLISVSHDLLYKNGFSTLIPLGLPLESKIKNNYLKTKYNLPETYIIYVGRFCNSKGYEKLIKVLNYIKANINLVILTDISSNELVNGLNSNINSTILTNIPHDECCSLIKHAGLFISFSTLEAFATAAREAIALGTYSLLSPIEAHKRIGLVDNQYFSMIDEFHDSQLIKTSLESENSNVFKTFPLQVKSWSNVSTAYSSVYHSVKIK